MATTIDVRQRLISIFPGLANTQFIITSPLNPDYNCIAWAAGEQGFWWWPGRFWPKDVPAAETRKAFMKAFATKGYEECANSNLEPGFEKICLYEKLGRPKHAARQLPSGLWTSKLGMQHDISHELDGLAGAKYGKPVLFMRRPIKVGGSGESEQAPHCES